ncbi:MAG: ParA family protein, partial [Saezia sp.]
LHAPDGRFRLKNLLSIFEPGYDIVLIDTQGARSVILEMAIVASHRLISPVTPEALSAREFRRGTLELLEDMQCYKHLGISLPKVEMLINRVPSVSNNAKLIQKMMRDVFQTKENIKMIQTTIPAIEVYGRSTILSQPVHRIETKKPSGRVTPAAADTIHSLARELFPDWSNRFKEVLAKPSGGKNAP